MSASNTIDIVRVELLLSELRLPGVNGPARTCDGTSFAPRSTGASQAHHRRVKDMLALFIAMPWVVIWTLWLDFV